MQPAMLIFISQDKIRDKNKIMSKKFTFIDKLPPLKFMGGLLSIWIRFERFLSIETYRFFPFISHCCFSFVKQSVCHTSLVSKANNKQKQNEEHNQNKELFIWEEKPRLEWNILVQSFSLRCLLSCDRSSSIAHVRRTEAQMRNQSYCLYVYVFPLYICIVLACEKLLNKTNNSNNDNHRSNNNENEREREQNI